MIVIVLLAVIGFSGYNIAKIALNYHKIDVANEEIVEKYVYEEKDGFPQVDFATLQADNSDVVGWIYIPDTNVNYPVLKGSSNQVYLTLDFRGNWSIAGSIFMDVLCSSDFSDQETMIYGHNMLDGSMFATLHNFSDPDFFANNKYMYIYTENRKLTYEVVSAYIYDDRHIMNSFNFNDDKVYAEWQQEALNPRSVSSNVRKDVKLTTDDKMLVLSTCLNGGGDGRYLVQGVLVKDEQAG